MPMTSLGHHNLLSCDDFCAGGPRVGFQACSSHLQPSCPLAQLSRERCGGCAHLVAPAPLSPWCSESPCSGAQMPLSSCADSPNALTFSNSESPFVVVSEDLAISIAKPSLALQLQTSLDALQSDADGSCVAVVAFLRRHSDIVVSLFQLSDCVFVTEDIAADCCFTALDILARYTAVNDLSFPSSTPRHTAIVVITSFFVAWKFTSQDARLRHVVRCWRSDARGPKICIDPSEVYQCEGAILTALSFVVRLPPWWAACVDIVNESIQAQRNPFEPRPQHSPQVTAQHKVTTERQLHFAHEYRISVRCKFQAVVISLQRSMLSSAILASHQSNNNVLECISNAETFGQRGTAQERLSEINQNSSGRTSCRASPSVDTSVPSVTSQGTCCTPQFCLVPPTAPSPEAILLLDLVCRACTASGVASMDILTHLFQSFRCC